MERTFVEFHHVQPYAKEGPATVANISLGCRSHNQYEAELIFGPHGASIVRDGARPSSMVVSERAKAIAARWVLKEG